MTRKCIFLYYLIILPLSHEHNSRHDFKHFAPLQTVHLCNKNQALAISPESETGRYRWCHNFVSLYVAFSACI